MSYKILTKNGIDNTNIDGARAEYFNSGMRDGIVKGALNEGVFIANASNSISFDSCELRIAGHRVLIDEAIFKTFSNKPSGNTRFSFIAQIVINDNRDVEFSIIIQSSNTKLIQDDLYKNLNGSGTYQVEIGRFTQLSDGTITDVIRTIDVITGNGNLENEYIRIGNVNTTMLDVGLNAEVDIENVVNEDTGLKQTNFNFGIPQGSTIKINGEKQSEVEFSSDPQTQINQKADKNGEYKELGVGYLANTLYISAGLTLGWRKLGSINNSNIASVDNPSIILLINGLYASQDAAGKAETGIIEFEARRNGGTYLTTGVNIICGNLKTEDFCSAIENGVVNLYMNLPSQYNSFKITVLNQSIAGSSNVNIFDYSGAYYGSTPPDNSTYAVLRNNSSTIEASLLEGIDINTLQGSAYWGKEFYAISNNLNAPSSSGHLTIKRIGNISTFQMWRTTNSSLSSERPTSYQRRFDGNVWTEWEEIVTSDGSYTTLGAGYLAKTIISSSDNSGWSKFGEILFSNISSLSAGGTYSAIILISGIFPTQPGSKSGIVEVDFRYADGIVEFYNLSILCGNIFEENSVCIVYTENIGFDLYIKNSSNYGSKSITIINEAWKRTNNVSYLTLLNEYYGSTAPDGAVYAVLRNNASELNGKPSSDYVDISSDQTISGQKTFTNDIILKSEDGTDKSLTISNNENSTIFKVRGAISANATVINSAAYYIRNRLNGNTGIIINPDTGIRVEKDNLLDIGYDKFRFKDLYLSGSITDGTNTTEVADLNKPNVRVASTTYTEPIYLLGVLNTNPALKDTWQDSRFYFIPDTQTLVTPNIGDGTNTVPVANIMTKANFVLDGTTLNITTT